MMTTTQSDVLIVGGGPAGSTIGALLAQRGENAGRLLLEFVQWAESAPERAQVDAFLELGQVAEVIRPGPVQVPEGDLPRGVQQNLVDQPSDQCTATQVDGSGPMINQTEQTVHSPVAPPPVVPWVLSAKSATALASQASRLADFIGARGELTADDVGWSLAGRAGFEHRAVLLGADRDQLLSGLAELAGGQPGASVIAGQTIAGGKTVFVFPGQGSQFVGMAGDIVRSSPAAADRGSGITSSSARSCMSCSCVNSRTSLESIRAPAQVSKDASRAGIPLNWSRASS